MAIFAKVRDVAPGPLVIKCQEIKMIIFFQTSPKWQRKMKIICLIFVLTLSCAIASEAVTYSTFSVNQTNSTNHTAEKSEKHPEGVVLVEIRYEAIKEPFFLTLVVLIAGLSKIGKEVLFLPINYYIMYHCIIKLQLMISNLRKKSQ